MYSDSNTDSEDEDVTIENPLIVILGIGQYGGRIYDCNGNDDISLNDIFDIFNNENLKKLCNKPKIYFIDCCRGDMRLKAQIHSSNDNDDNDDQIEETKNDGSDDDNTHKPLIQNVNTKGRSNGNGNNNSSNNSRNNDNSNKTYTIPSDCRSIYATIEGYAAIDGGNKGGYLIRSVTKAFAKDEIFNKNLDAIIKNTRKIMKNLLKGGQQYQTQIIDSNDTIDYEINFQTRNE